MQLMSYPSSELRQEYVRHFKDGSGRTTHARPQQRPHVGEYASTAVSSLRRCGQLKIIRTEQINTSPKCS